MGNLENYPSRPGQESQTDQVEFCSRVRIDTRIPSSR